MPSQSLGGLPVRIGPTIAPTPTTKATWGWIIYDLANTIFALGVVGLYVPSWLHDSDLSDSSLAFTEAIAGALVIVIAPWIGARTDRSGRRLPALLGTTVVAVLATAGLASFSPTTTLILLGVGLLGVNAGSAVYDSLLPSVSDPGNRARVSGLGVGIGYVGSFIGLGIGLLAFEIFDAGYPTTFRLLAAGFAAFSIPIFLWVHEQPITLAPGTGQNPTNGDNLIRGQNPIRSLASAWRKAARTPGVLRFLLGRFLYTDAINTLIGGFLALFVLTELNLSTRQTNNLLGVAIAAAIGGGLGGGRLTTLIGARMALRAVLLIWVLALGLGALTAVIGVTWLIWIVGALGGTALGATWAADRVLMLELSPPEHIGEFYGLYATVGRFATILGPLVWAAVVDGLGWGRRAALLVLAGFILAGWWIVRKE
jgi:UMF1 family MFS transporter